MSWSQMNAVSNEPSQMNGLQRFGLNSYGTLSASSMHQNLKLYFYFGQTKC